MVKTFRFQFSLANDHTAEHLQAISAKYRSLYVEMALDAWFDADQGKNPDRSRGLTLVPKENSNTTRFRLSISNEDIITNLRNIPSRHRSFVTEMALNAWMETKTGTKMYEIITGRSMKQPSDCTNPLPEKFELRVDELKASRTKSKKEPDTEQLMRNALAFD